jgi:exosortase K
MKAAYKVIGGGLVLAAAYQLKDFYSRAGSEDLAWIIGPTAWVAEIFSDLSFSPEPGYGWVDVRHNVVIAPVCAGMNFLIIAFCMSSFQILWKRTSAKQIFPAIAVAGGVSYLLTIIANAARILLAVTLFPLDIHNAWLTPDMLHRVAGIVVYYLLLCSYSQAINYYFDSGNQHLQERKNLFAKQTLLLVPLFWYLLFSVGVPFANNSFTRNPELFARHATTVALVTVLLTLILYKVQRWHVSVRKPHYTSPQHTGSALE